MNTQDDWRDEEYFEYIETTIADNEEFSKRIAPIKEKYKKGEISFETYKTIFSNIYIEMFGKDIINNFFKARRKKNQKIIGIAIICLIALLIIIYLMNV